MLVGTGRSQQKIIRQNFVFVYQHFRIFSVILAEFAPKMEKSRNENSPTKLKSRSFSVRVENYLEACRVCMTLPPKK
jgi:hypothetical protein